MRLKVCVIIYKYIFIYIFLPICIRIRFVGIYRTCVDPLWHELFVVFFLLILVDPFFPFIYFVPVVVVLIRLYYLCICIYTRS